MPRKIWTYTIISIIFILSFFHVFGNNGETLSPEDAVMIALKQSKAEISEININSYVSLENQFLTIDRVRKICDDIANGINMTELEHQDNDEEGFKQKIVWGIINEGVHAVLIVQSTMFEDFKESNIVLDIIMTNGEYNLNDLGDKIKDILSGFGEEKTNITVAGYYKGRVDNRELENVMEKMFTKLKASKTEEIKEENLISITGYSSKIRQFITYGGRKANINVAARYNSYEDRTYIWIGTPLIVTEY